MLLSGRYPTPEATDEIVVDERAAAEYGLEVGVRTPLTGLVSMESFETRSLGDATVVGVVRTPFDLVDDPTTEHLVMAGPGFLDGRWRELARPGTILWLGLHDRTDVASVVSDLSQIIPGDVRPEPTCSAPRSEQPTCSGADCSSPQRWSAPSACS